MSLLFAQRQLSDDLLMNDCHSHAVLQKEGEISTLSDENLPDERIPWITGNLKVRLKTELAKKGRHNLADVRSITREDSPLQKGLQRCIVESYIALRG